MNGASTGVFAQRVADGEVFEAARGQGGGADERMNGTHHVVYLLRLKLGCC